MESLLMQLAMAAMSQFGGGRSVPMSGGMPIPMPSRPMAPYSSPAPVSNGWQPSMQASTLASTTCLLRSGRISRDQAITLLDRLHLESAEMPGVRDQAWGMLVGLRATVAERGGVDTVEDIGPSSIARVQALLDELANDPDDKHVPASVR